MSSIDKAIMRIHRRSLLPRAKRYAIQERYFRMLTRHIHEAFKNPVPDYETADAHRALQRHLQAEGED